MRGRSIGVLIAVSVVVGVSVVGATSRLRPASHAAAPAVPASVPGWAAQSLTGTARFKGAVPLAVSHGTAKYVGRHAAGSLLSVNFGFPIRNRVALDRLIAYEAKTHRYLTRDQLYAKFSPPSAQLDALQGWLVAKGFRVTHSGLDRLSLAATATTATVERTLGVRINDYVRPATTFEGLKVKPYVFFANTTDPKLPARFGLQSITGLSDVDRFYTQAQLDCGDEDDGDRPVNPLCVDTRSGGYFPSDIRSMYDVTGHGYDGTGQTVGFTLWGAGERQPAMTAFATATGDTPITVDPPCTATGNSPTTPSSCTTVQVAGDHLLTILENGNTNSLFGSNVETALDIEQAHGIATHAAMKYYDADCSSATPPGSGLTNGSSCNGSDVGLEEAVEDAANDPTLHSVSNSWGYGGETEWGTADPFAIATSNSFAIAAAAGTTFYFSTGDNGTFESGYPADSPYVVAVGGTTLFSTGSPSTLSTEDTWAAAGSWCSNIIARPSWQNGPGVAANAPCPGRAVPDISAVADTNSSVRFVSSTNATGGTQSGGVGGTSVAAPELNGLEAVTENFIAAQTYPGATPPIGFEGPVMYQLGNSPNYSSYFRDVYCGNTASPSSGPDGDSAQPGWDAATGWGAPDWFDYSTGYAIALGATNLSVPPSLTPGYGWTCAKTPSNSSERSVSFPTASTGYAVGAASGTTPWYAKFLASGSWGAVNTFFKTSDGGQSWVPSNSDMTSVACTSSSACVEVGDGGRARTTADGGATWSDAVTGYNKALTQVQCPSGSVCYAAGDRGTVLKSTDGGATWSYLASTDGNPIYGLSCPSASTCYATDIYAHVVKTSDGGATWTWQQTPVTTPGVNVPGSGGPNPFAGLMSISCSDVNTCVATGLYVVPSGSGQALPSMDPPIVTTTDGGATWTLRTSNGGGAVTSSTTLAAAAAAGATNIKVVSVSNIVVGQSLTVDTGANLETVKVTAVGTAGATGTGITFTPALALAHASGVAVGVAFAPNFLQGISCLPGTTTCTAVGRAGTIVTTTDLANWTRAVSGTTNMLNSVTCLSASFCMASGQNGTIDTWNGTAWTATTGNGGGVFLASVTCLDPDTCFAAGKQGVTIATANGGTTWTQQAGGGTTQQMNAVSCPTASMCFAVGNAGTILATTNGGQTWLPQVSGTTSNLSGLSCPAAGVCVAAGAAGTVRYTTDGATWLSGVSGTTNALNGVSCSSPTACAAVGAAGTIVTTGSGGATWTAQTSGTTAALNAVACPASGACYATGAVASGNAVMLHSTDGGVTWTSQTSNSNVQALSGLACLDASNCFAGGAAGTVVSTTDAGTTWTQQGNPLSGPTTALNATVSALDAINGTACSTNRCFMATGSSGDIMTTPLLTVTVHSSSVFGTAPNLSGLAANNAALTYAPAAEAGNVTGTLTCSTTATAASDAGPYPISACGGLADTGFSVVYDYADSTNTVTPAPQTLTFAPLPDVTFGDADFPVSAVASSGLAPSFSASGSCTVASAIVHLTGGGSCAITASQAGNNDYQAAPSVTQTFTVRKADQTINFAAIPDQKFGNADFQVTADSTSGLPVSLAVTAGHCTLSSGTSPSTLHLTGAGTCTITASQTGDDDYKAATAVVRSFSVAMEDQTITFGGLADKTYGDADFGLTAVASSGLAVTYAATGACTVSSATVHIAAAGTCSLTASQAGDADYNPAPDVTQAFTIKPADQTITFAAIPAHTFGDPDFTVAPTASSGLPVTLAVGPTDTCAVTGATVHITGAGSCSLTASQAGNANYNAAPQVTQTFAIAKANQTITLAAIPNHTYGDADFSVAPTSSAGLPVTLTASGNCGLLNGTTVHITGAGSCSLTAAQAGNANYNAATSVTQTFAIAKTPQTISFAPIPNKAFGAPDFEVNAVSSARLVVSLAATGPCTLSAGASPAELHITGVGTCSITASQAGDANNGAAPSVTQSFTIGKGSQTITFAQLPDVTFGAADFNVTATSSSGLPVSFAGQGACTVSGTTVHIVQSGSCTVTASQPGNGSYNAAPSVSRTFAIRNSVAGTAVGLLLRSTNGGSASFAVDANPPFLRGPIGAIVYDGPPVPQKHGKAQPGVHFESLQVTSFGISADGNSAWFAGVGRDGRSFLAHVEDNGSRFNLFRRDTDVFELWINGVLQTGDGSLSSGNVDIELPPDRRH